MPSCVVRWCKNFTKKCNKSQGISYHAFPRNQDQKDNWVRIIRDCRDENNWNPSSSSTVCSVHFDNDDFVTTAKGLRRLVPDAIPKKLLSNSPETHTNCTSSSMRQISPNVRGVANDPQQSSSSGMISSPLQVSPPTDKFESAGYCRLCAATYCHSKLFSIHSDDVLKKLVVNMTKRLNTNVDFSQEHLPTTICFDCVTKLYTAYDFVVGIDLAQLTLNEKSVQNDQNRMPENLIFSKNMIPSTYLQQVLPNCDAAAAENNVEHSLPFEINMTTPVLPVSSNIEVGTNDCDKPRLYASSTTTSLQQLSSNIGAETSNFEHQLLLESNSNIPFVLDTPRKRRLKNDLNKKKDVIERQRKNLKRLNQKVRRLENRNESLKNIVKNLKERNYIDTDLFNTLNENIVAADLFNNFNRKKLHKNIRYTQSIKKFCLTLNYYSPRAYDYIRQSFDTCLPHRKTLAKWYGHIKGEPGFTDESFEALKAKAQVSQHRLLCSLVFDEVAIRPQKLWDGKKNIGFVDMGTGVKEGAALASQALVFLLVGINQHFKVPVGYFLSTAVTGEQKANLIELCLMKCSEADIDVVSLTCDGHATNITALELLGCDLKAESLKTTFQHPSNDSKIACILDPSHMIKLIRNHLESKKQFLDGDEREIKWATLEHLNKFQEDEGLHLANKLTKNHIHFRNKIMKVKLASQIFSSSVANAINICREVLNLKEFMDSEATENFISKMNTMFDIFNSRGMKTFDFRQPISQKNFDKIFNFMNDLEKYIMTMKIKITTKRKVKKSGRTMFVITKFFKPIVETRCKTGFIGTLINMKSLKHLYEELINNGKLVYLPTYKLSQDHLEIFFSSIRLQCGSNDNPNVRQFKGSYKKLLTFLEIECISTGNCVPLEKLAILNCSSSTQIINTTIPYQRHDENEDSCVSSLHFLEKCETNITDLAEQLQVEQFNDCRNIIIGYISGNIAYTLHKHLKCEVCLAQLTTTEKLYFHKLIVKKNRGGLKFPSKDLFDICCVCEIVVRKLAKEKIQLYNDRQHLYIMTKIMAMFIGNQTTFSNIENEHVIAGADHKVSLIKCIVQKYLNIRLHYISKTESISRTLENKRQVYKKLTQHKGF